MCLSAGCDEGLPERDAVQWCTFPSDQSRCDMASRFNHSCNANCEQVWNKAGRDLLTKLPQVEDALLLLRRDVKPTLLEHF